MIWKRTGHNSPPAHIWEPLACRLCNCKVVSAASDMHLPGHSCLTAECKLCVLQSYVWLCTVLAARCQRRLCFMCGTTVCTFQVQLSHPIVKETLTSQTLSNLFGIFGTTMAMSKYRPSVGSLAPQNLDHLQDNYRAAQCRQC